MGHYGLRLREFGSTTGGREKLEIVEDLKFTTIFEKMEFCY